MMDGSGMMWGMVLGSLIVLILVVLAIAALVKVHLPVRGR
jgi:Ca2+/Na+ antiporter